MARVNLYEELYEKLIDDRGLWADWQRASVCQCVSRDSGQPDFTCKICHGLGYRYMPPKRILVAVTNLNGRWELKTPEVREVGTAYITPKADVIMGYRDRLIFPDLKCVFSEVLHWDEEMWGRGISPKTYRNILSVEMLVSDDCEFEDGVDFEITEDRHHLRWLNEKYVDKLDGMNMSILYMTTPSYFVSDLMHELRATLSDRKPSNIRSEDFVAGITFRELPKQYQITRENFIYGVKEPEPIVKEKNEITYDDDGGITI